MSSPAQEAIGQTTNSYDGGDSSYEEDGQLSTASLASSILEYRTVQGRTYHSNSSNSAEYWGPNDDRQNECMDIIHHSLTLSLDGKLFRAPLDMTKVEKVLDIGTGTGIWAMDMADMYPNTTFIGTDISPIQPGWVPPNLFFEHEDMAQPWSFADNSFDFVHMRYLFGAVRDWNQLFQEAYRVCKPGGYIETVESDAMIFAEDGSIAEGSPIEQWGKMFGEAGKKIGRSFLIIGEDVQRKGLEAAGFKDLVQWDFNCPTTPWSKDKKLREIGRFNYAAGNKDLEGMVLYMFSMVLGWSHEEIQVYLALLRKQLRDRNVHPVAKLRVIYAQKPSDAPAA